MKGGIRVGTYGNLSLIVWCCVEVVVMCRLVNRLELLAWGQLLSVLESCFLRVCSMYYLSNSPANISQVFLDLDLADCDIGKNAHLT